MSVLSSNVSSFSTVEGQRVGNLLFLAFVLLSYISASFYRLTKFKRSEMSSEQCANFFSIFVLFYSRRSSSNHVP